MKTQIIFIAILKIYKKYLIYSEAKLTDVVV